MIRYTGISPKATVEDQSGNTSTTSISPLGSLGESVSGFHAYYDAAQLSEESFDALDGLAFKLENGLLRLVEALEHKRDTDTWIDTLVVQESNNIYLANEPDPK